ncbi:protein FAM135B [Osmerus mordax]|uniref:protein FAM135B n=1 Tax=Osmerus mordax TaxID=8014 RepID=UPI0035103666
MSEVQGTLEFSVELHTFHNVDLFQRGFYQVRAALKVSPRVPHRLIATTKGNTGECSLSSSGVYDGAVFSRIFQILYRNEEIAVNDSMTFKVHLLLDGERLEEALSEVDFQLKLDLHFTDNEQQLAEITTVPVISSRTLGLHFHPRKGLHHHVPVMFDYFHLSVISVSIHASLVALHQPLISFARTGKGAWLGKGSPESGSDQSAMSIENLMFGAGYCKPVITEGSFYVPSEDCLQRAHTWHRRLCRLLLVALRGLRSYFTALMKEIPQLPQLEIEELPVEETLNQMTIELQLQGCHEKVAEQVSRDVSQLCSQLSALWSQFLEAAVPNPHILSYLAQEHHTLRVRRFSEAYFFTEHSKETSLTFQEELINKHGQMASEVRSSDYLIRMPPLPVECLDIDGDWNSLPIIFEDRYVESPCTEWGAHVPTLAGSDNQVTSDPPTITANGIYELGQGASSPAIPHKPSDTEDCMDLPAYISLIGGQSRSTSSISSLQDLVLDNESPEPSQADQDPGDQDPGEQALSEQDPDPDGSLGSGLRYITDRPTDEDPHRGDGVSVFSSEHNPSTDSHRGGEDGAVIHLTGEDDSVSQDVLENKSAGKSELDGEESDVAMPLTQSIDDESEDAPLSSLSTHPAPLRDQPITPPFTGNLRREMNYRGGTGGFKIMKRSSSVISDSGIESEPSSVAWPLEALRGRPPLDFSSEREILQPLVRRRGAAHRSSLEGGLQTESNGSLGGIQASLTSISSLPYEEEELQRQQLSKLTKSVSAPQISSPEDTEEDQGPANQEPDTESEGTNGYGWEEGSSTFAAGGGGPLERSQEPPPSLEDILEGDLLDAGLPAPSLEVSTAQRASGSSPRQITGPVNTCLNEEPRDIVAALSDSPKAFWLQTSMDGPDVKSTALVSQTEEVSCLGDQGMLGSEVVAACSCGTKPCAHENMVEAETCPIGDECQSLNQIKLLDLEDKNLLGDPRVTPLPQQDTDNTLRPVDLVNLQTNGAARLDDLIGFAANEREPRPLECHSQPTAKIPSSGLAFMNRKVVEVVNMSVSCAPTCLPFSSVLRDSPSISGLSTRQATSPITHQPLGSFGIISSSSSNTLGTEHETNERMLHFFKAKEDLLREMSLQAGLYSDLPLLASDLPYFPPEEEDEEFEDGIHLVVCVHGLDGNSADLRLVKTFIELGLPGSRLDFLMSERNQTDTFADFDTMTDRLLDEIIQHIQLYNLTIGRISFIGHSLGNVIIRSVLTRPRFRCYLCKLHTFLSLSGPHLGTLYNSSTLVSTGLWLMQKLKKSGSLLQLTFRDHTDPRKTFLYLLSQKPGLQFFKNVVLVASPQDRYVPFHSARIEMCRTALKDRTTGPVYTEMINNLLQPLVGAPDCRLIRQNVFHALPNTANTLIGRAAHIAVLDSELFLEKFFLVAGLNYFK